MGRPSLNAGDTLLWARAPIHHLSASSNGGHNMSSYPTLLPPCLFCHDALYPAPHKTES